ncbi:MAG: molecular chaperone TorD family protein [Natronomonas sp.]
MSQPANTGNELADLYAFVSGVLADPPDEVAVERLANETFPSEASPQALQNGFRMLRKWQAGVDDPAAEARRLNTVHTELFVGPRPRMQIHESWYAGDYLGEPLAAVKGTYEDLGVTPSEDLREEPDHAAVELKTLEILARDGAEDYRQAFLSIHGWWLPDLAEDIQEMADDTFYQAVGWILDGTLEADIHALGLNRNELEAGYLDSTV